MIRLLLCLAVGAAVALLLIRKPMVQAGIVLAVWAAVPPLAMQVLTGRPATSSLAIHPATWLLLECMVVQAVQRGRIFAQVLRRHRIFYTAAACFIALSLFTTFVGQRHGLGLPIDVILAPLGLLLFVSVLITEIPERARIWRNILLWVAASESILALLQLITHKWLFYESYFQQQYWYRPGWDRWMGTTSHPLVLSLLIASVIPLLVGLRSGWLQLALITLFVPAMLATQSRTGLVVMGLALLYVLFASKTSAATKLLVIPLLIAAVVVIAQSSLVTSVIGRITDDAGSTQARVQALDWMAANWWHYTLFGGGARSSYALVNNGILKTSLENSFFMYVLDFGLVFAGAYFLMQLWLVGRSAVVPGMRGIPVAGLIGFIMPFTFSALAADNVSAMMLWSVLALCYARVDGLTSIAVAGQAPTRESPLAATKSSLKADR